jgi:thiamine-monophosphate kinase
VKESDFHDWLYRQGGLDPAKVSLGPGDDMAIVRFPRDDLLVACDQVLDGVHISLAEHGPEAVGRKALARNLSDIAAMAALPTGCVASVALPRGTEQAVAEGIYRGLRELGDSFNCPLVGGDVAVWDHPVAVSVTVFAGPAGATGGITPIRRTGARAGNALCVTGRLGGGWSSDHHLTFTPRVREAIVLALRYRVRAMIDISDGLARDLGRLCEANGLGAEIWADAIPIAEAAATGRDVSPLQAALGDGEDYELLFALPRGQATRAAGDTNVPCGVTEIGRLTKEPGLVLVHADGRREEIEEAGWDHET